MASLSALSQKSALRPSVARPSRLLIQAKAAVKSKAKALPMVCLDCGYVYDGKIAFDELPGSYSCPACGSKKNRFRAFSGSPARGNDVKSMQARRVALREELAASGEDGSDNTFLLLTLATIVASIGGFIYLKGGL